MNATTDPTIVMNEEQGNALQAKIVTMVSLFSISMVVGLAPMLISMKFGWFKKSDDKIRSNQSVIGLLSFGGGVLFATTFMHLLPEVDENVKVLQETGDIPDLPIHLAALIMCCGFFMMYLVEELVHVYINSRENKTANTSFTRVLSIRRKSTESGETSEQPIKELESQKNHGHSHLPVKMEDTKVAAFRGLLIVLALSIHELFEGLAVGLESSVRNVWYMFGAVSAHKYIIAFCIGVELLAAGTKRWLSIVYIFTFSFVSALGIAVGILLVGGAGATEAGLTSVILQGLACGTLVYVVFFEVWRQDRTGLMQFVCAILGFTLMVILQTIAEQRCKIQNFTLKSLTGHVTNQKTATGKVHQTELQKLQKNCCIVACEGDIPNIYEVCGEIPSRDPNIPNVVTNSEINEIKRLVKENQPDLITIDGTSQVHQVQGTALLSRLLIMKSLMYICDSNAYEHKYISASRSSVDDINKNSDLNLSETDNPSLIKNQLASDCSIDLVHL